jgi:hypothetical protein
MTVSSRLTVAEAASISERLSARPYPRDAGAMRRPISSPSVRAPLGLSIVADIDEPEPERERDLDTGPAYHPLVVDALAGMSPEAREEPATIANIFEIAVDIALRTYFDGQADTNASLRTMRAALAESQLENAQLRATIAEIRAKQNEHEFVLERLKIEKRGPPGVKGERGRDGAEGSRGETGQRGERGPPGPRVVAFETDDSAFVAVELLSTGQKGASLNLRGMFESYHAQVEGEAVEEEREAAAASRAVIEREAAAVREGRPAR